MNNVCGYTLYIMPPRLLHIKRKIIKELNSIQEKRELLALEESRLFWKECGFWYKLKADYFLKNKSKSWVSFLRDIGVPLNTADFKVSLYKKWIIELGYSPDDLNGTHTRKLHRAIPYTNSRKDAEKLLKKARALSFDSFLKWLKARF